MTTPAQMMAGLGVTKSHSRPKTSNDNPYSESQYKTLKYRHDFPERFGSLEDARAWGTQFFTWYNEEHRHSGIGLHTPCDVHFGLAEQLREMRADVLQAVYAKHPERFVRKPPEPPKLPAAAWINKPAPDGPLIPAQRWTDLPALIALTGSGRARTAGGNRSPATTNGQPQYRLAV